MHRYFCSNVTQHARERLVLYPAATALAPRLPCTCRPFSYAVLQFFSVEDAPLRSVLWSHDSRVVIFPPFESYPEISSKGFTDLRAYVAAGNNVVFMGSYIALQVRSLPLLFISDFNQRFCLLFLA